MRVHSKSFSGRRITLALLSVLLIPTVAIARNGGPEVEHGQETSTPKVTASASPRVTEDSGRNRGSGNSGSGRRSSSDDAKPEASPSSKSVPAADFCKRFTDAATPVSTEANSRFDKLQTNFAERGTKINDDFTGIKSKNKTSRADADAKLAAKLKELEAKAVTPQEKAAVAQFEASLRAAITARRAAIDAADAAFVAGLGTTVNDRQAQLKAAATAYRNTVNTIMTSAKASCAAGTNPATVRASVKSQMDAAGATLEAARKAAAAKGEGTDALKATHKAAVEAAQSTFKASVKTALTKLKTTLGSN